MSDDPRMSGATPPTGAVAPKRGARRKRVLKGARLVLGGGMSTINCTIKDVSATGARVRVSDITQVSGMLQLAMPDGEILDAEVIRNTGLEIGLRFLGDQRPSLAPPPDTLEVVIAELEQLPIDSLVLQITTLPEHDDEEVAEAAQGLRLAADKLTNVLRSRTKGW